MTTNVAENIGVSHSFIHLLIPSFTQQTTLCLLALDRVNLARGGDGGGVPLWKSRTSQRPQLSSPMHTTWMYVFSKPLTLGTDAVV